MPTYSQPYKATHQTFPLQDLPEVSEVDGVTYDDVDARLDAIDEKIVDATIDTSDFLTKGFATSGGVITSASS